jgi:polyisoprenoid-binding protein YceI
MSTSTILETGTALPVGTWNLDPVHSHVGFAVEYGVGTFRGSFAGVEASLRVDESGDVALTGSAPVGGVRVQDENLAAHLQSPDFFDAERTPSVEFRSTEIERDGDEVRVFGGLEIKGATVPVKAAGKIVDPAVDAHGNTRFGLTLETVVDRTEFGLNWNMDLPNGEPALANDVMLSVDLYFVKE